MTATVEPADVLAGLRELRDLLADPGHWTQGDMARDEYGNDVDVDEPDACRWCLLGGILKVAPAVSGRSLRREMLALEMRLEVKAQFPVRVELAHFNDTHTHAEVIDVIDRAVVAVAERAA